MNGRLKTILLIALLVIVGGVAITHTITKDKAREKAQAELAAQQKAEAAKQKADEPKYVAPKQQVESPTAYSDGELINMANENYAQVMGNNNNYNFENVVSRTPNGNGITVTFNATVNGNPQQITMNFEQVNNTPTIVK